jgi:hypothetical protein
MTTRSAAGRAARSSALVQVAAPRDFPAQAPHPDLTPCLDKQPQGTLNNGTLRRSPLSRIACRTKVVIDIDVRTHLTSPCVRIADSSLSVKAPTAQ